MKNVSFMHMTGVVREIQLFIIVMFLMSLFVGLQNKVYVENYYGRSPLDRHAALGDNTVKLLFELGADVERVDRYRNSPLHTAASFFTRIQFDFLWKKEQMFT